MQQQQQQKEKNGKSQHHVVADWRMRTICEKFLRSQQASSSLRVGLLLRSTSTRQRAWEQVAASLSPSPV
jgi:hypothetical protein